MENAQVYADFGYTDPP